MESLNSKIFICYAWEDLKDVNGIVADIQHELGSSIVVPQYDERVSIEDHLFPLIEHADIILVFVSETSKNSNVVKKCISYSNNLNKRILPIELTKSNFFSSLPQEFKFRTKPVIYKDDVQRAKFFSQLKASCGLEVENGDNYGCLVHITIDSDATVYRYGIELCHALAGSDNTIRLTKGTHKLDFVADADQDARYSLSYAVSNNDGEQFVDVPLSKKLKEIKEQEEKEAREAELRKQFELEHAQENLELEQRKKELEILEREQAIRDVQQQRSTQQAQQISEYPQEQNKDKKNSCLPIFLIIAGFVLIQLILGLISFIASL